MRFKLRAPVPSEAAVLRSCLALLRHRRIMAWRSNSGVAWLPGKGGRSRPVRFGVPGQADITGILPDGRRLEVETKRPGAKPRPEQLAFLDGIRSSGGVALWVSSVDRLAEALDLAAAGIPIALDGRRA